jgi:hypothetical protein
MKTKMKKYEDGGSTRKARLEGRATKKMGKAQRTYKEAEATLSEAKSSGMKMDYADAEQLFNRSARQGDRAKKLKAKAAMMKTGGMVNSNAKVSALKVAGSKGVKSGVNPKAAASKVAKGRVGGTSAAPKTATPKAQMGGSLKASKNSWKEQTSNNVKKKLAKEANQRSARNISKI